MSNVQQDDPGRRAIGPGVVPHGAGRTECGPVRSHNEDCFVANDDLGLYVVADGMGGHNAGEVASRLAVDTLLGFIQRSHDTDDFSWPWEFDPTLSFSGNRLQTAIRLANQRVHQVAGSSDGYAGMGTTVVAAIVAPQRAVVAHVGDSRLYLLNDGHLSLLTRDDTLVAALEGDGHDLSVPASHPMRNVLTRVLGAGDDVEVHVQQVALRGGETLLLCSDGVHGVLSQADLESVLSGTGQPIDLVSRLLEAAIAGGSRDNVTAVVVRCQARS